jgi:hypothetical protein
MYNRPGVHFVDCPCIICLLWFSHFGILEISYGRAKHTYIPYLHTIRYAHTEKTVFSADSWKLLTLKNNMALENTQGAFVSSLQHQGAQICSPSSLPYILLNSGSSDEVSRLISGTYYHPMLIPHIGCWLSAAFA